MSFTAIRGGLLIVGLGVAAIGAALHVVINYHERAYVVFLAGVLCILASAGIDFWKKRKQNTITRPSLLYPLIITVGLLIAAADLFLFRLHTHMKTSAVVAFGTAFLLACAFVGLMVWQARRSEPSEQS